MSVYLKPNELTEALRALEDAKRTNSHRCTVPRKNLLGNEARLLPKAAGLVSYGPHANVFLTVDPFTLQVRCGACALGPDGKPEWDSTVQDDTPDRMPGPIEPERPAPVEQEAVADQQPARKRKK